MAMPKGYYNPPPCGECGALAGLENPRCGECQKRVKSRSNARRYYHNRKQRKESADQAKNTNTPSKKPKPLRPQTGIEDVKDLRHGGAYAEPGTVDAGLARFLSLRAQRIARMRKVEAPCRVGMVPRKEA